MKAQTLLCALLCLGISLPYVRADDLSLIRSVQDASLSALDPDAPNIKLSQWLAELGRVPLTALNWQINDCGEGGDGLAAPTCVEGSVSISPNRVASISVAVAPAEGTSGGKQVIFMMYVKDGLTIDFAKSIRELEILVEQRRK